MAKPKPITVKATKDDQYKAQIKEQMGDTQEDKLQTNIAIGFAEALKELGHNNFEVVIIQ